LNSDDSDGENFEKKKLEKTTIAFRSNCLARILVVALSVDLNGSTSSRYSMGGFSDSVNPASTSGSSFSRIPIEP
jgi:hypothetical protein